MKGNLAEPQQHEIGMGANEAARFSRRSKVVYTIIEKGNGQRSLWLRIGTAYINRDDSLTVYLNALPVNSKLHIRDWPDEPHQ